MSYYSPATKSPCPWKNLAALLLGGRAACAALKADSLTEFSAPICHPQGERLVGGILNSYSALYYGAVVMTFNPKLDSDSAFLTLLFTATALALAHLCCRV